MWRLSALIVGIGAVLALATLDAVAWGHTEQAPDELQEIGLQECAGKPCYLGITPGVTSWEDAATTLIADGGTIKDYPPRIELVRDDGVFATFTRGRTDSPMVVLNLRNYHGPNRYPSMAHLIKTFGEPCSVVLHEDMGYVQIQYPKMMVIVDVESISFQPDSPLNALTLYDTADAIRCASGKRSTFATRPWLGFASISRYRRYRFED